MKILIAWVLAAITLGGGKPLKPLNSIRFVDLPAECRAAYDPSLVKIRKLDGPNGYLSQYKIDLDGDEKPEWIVKGDIGGNGGAYWFVFAERNGKWRKIGDFGAQYFTYREYKGRRGLLCSWHMGATKTAWSYYEMRDGRLQELLAVDEELKLPALDLPQSLKIEYLETERPTGQPPHMREDVQIIVKRDSPEDPDYLEIRQSGKKVFSLQTSHSADVVRFEKESYHGHRRGYSEPLQNGADFRKYLIDMKGDGDKRHLVIVDWNGGNHGEFKGYLLDAKNHFACLGEIPAGEAYDYPFPNPNLEFWYDEAVEYFGAQGEAYLLVPMRLKNGKRVCAARKNETFNLQPYAKELKSETDRRMLFVILYSNLASHGLLKKGPEYARKVGYTDAEIQQYAPEALNKIRQCKFWKYLKPINE